MDNCPVKSPGMYMNMVREGQHSVLSQVKQSNQMLDKHMTQNICLLRSHSLRSHDSVCR